MSEMKDRYENYLHSFGVENLDICDLCICNSPCDECVGGIDPSERKNYRFSLKAERIGGDDE